MADEVRAQIHGHEARELQEARVNLPPRTGINHRHRRDDIVLEPRVRPLGRQRVDSGRGLAGVDRAAHHRQALRQPGILVGIHQRGRSKGRRRRLADRQHVRPLAPCLANHLKKFNEIIDIIVEIEPARGRRNQLRVAPVGDIDVVLGQHPLDRAAKKRRIMARHRRDDQQRRLVVRSVLPEAFQLTERLAKEDILVDRDAFSPTRVSISPNSGFPRGAEAWANTSRLAATRGPMELYAIGFAGLFSHPAPKPANLLALVRRERCTS